MSKPVHDIVIFGATSFVGQILCRYFCGLGEASLISWAIAGRSQSKLEALKAELGTNDLPIIIADASDSEALKTLCGSTRVVISTVGPYALYGDLLVKTCVEYGIDYCDLTGEVQWVRRMIDAHADTAKQSGARIVHCCGFDSIPSDFGVFFTQQQAQARHGEYCEQIAMRVHGLKGGASGGTIASLLNVVDETKRNPALRKDLANPYLLCEERKGVRQRNVGGPSFDKTAGGWLAPFVMAAVNTRVVLHSHELMNFPYGKSFRYDEAMFTGSGMKGRIAALSITTGIVGLMIGGALKPSRWLLERFVLPAPGEGPSQKEQETGYFKLRFYGRTGSGKTLCTEVQGDRDPGYGSTAKMLGQAALCLLKDKGEKGGGFWTPASLLGETLLTRLQDNAGLTFKVVE